MKLYRCQGCGEWLEEKDLDRETFAPEICHAVAVQGWFNRDEFYPEPCGPVDEIETEEQKGGE